MASFWKNVGDFFARGSADAGDDGDHPFAEAIALDDEDGEFSKLGAGDRGALGTTAQSISGGFVATDDRLPRMTGPQRYDVMLEMIQDFTIIASGVRLFLNLIAKSNWNVIPPKDEHGEPVPGAQEKADLIAEMMNDMTIPWSRIVRKLAMYRFYGFAISEWVMEKRDDGVIGMRSIEHRPQKSISRWEITEGGNVEGAWQRQANGQEVLLPRDKIIYMVDDSLTDHPEGMGLLRHLIRTVTRLKGYEQLEEVGFETDLRGIPVAYAPLKEISKESETRGIPWANRKKQPMVQYISGHIRNKKQGILLDSETYRSNDEQQSPSAIKKWEAQLLSGDASSFGEIAAAIERVNREGARVLGIEQIMLDGGGSQAMHKSKTGTFYMTVTSTIQELGDSLERDWLDAIWDVNGWDEELKPDLTAEEIRDEDITEVTTALANIARAGVTFSPDDEAILEVLDMMGLSRPSQQDLLDKENDAALLAAATAASLANPADPANPAPKPGAPAIPPAPKPAARPLPKPPA